MLIQNEKKKDYNVKILKEIARHLDVDPDRLFTENEEKEERDQEVGKEEQLPTNTFLILHSS